MAGRAYRSLLFICLCLNFVAGVYGITNSSNQHKLLDKLFNNYKKTVRPVSNDSLPVEVQLGIRLRKVMKVDSKSQVMTAGLWVTQVWKNPFLTWDPAKMGGIKKIVVDPNDVWTPDIGLMNNADESSSFAGGKEKFKTAVIIQNDGWNLWRAPATFQSDCDIHVRYWPFDTQRCPMIFSSFTMTNEELRMEQLGSQKRNKADNFATSGEWTVQDIQIDRKDVQYDCCKAQFQTIRFEITLKRRPQYFILNLIIPSAVLCILTLISFAIPSESGERIGFITTLLLAMTVYLLIIAEVLPETSSQLPVTGLLFVVTIGESAVILLATIIILRCFHGEGLPYVWLQKLYCCCCPCNRKTPLNSTVTPHTNTLANGNTIPNNGDIDTPSDIPSAFNQFDSKEFNNPTWQDIALFLNRVFFVLSVVMVVATFLVVYLTALII